VNPRMSSKAVGQVAGPTSPNGPAVSGALRPTREASRPRGCGASADCDTAAPRWGAAAASSVEVAAAVAAAAPAAPAAAAGARVAAGSVVGAVAADRLSAGAVRCRVRAAAGRRCVPRLLIERGGRRISSGFLMIPNNRSGRLRSCAFARSGNAVRPSDKLSTNTAIRRMIMP
jgi:hypothetical protein